MTNLTIPEFLVRKDKPMPKLVVTNDLPATPKPVRTAVWDTEKEHWKLIEKAAA